MGSERQSQGEQREVGSGQRDDLKQFRDPLGLVSRLVFSKKSAARWALLQRAISYAATPLDLLLEPLERGRLRRSRAQPLPMVLIVGPPRAGTTLLGQVLSRYLDVDYFDNLSSLFPRAPITLKSLLPGPGVPPGLDFESFYGSTSGWRAPSDAFHIWNRWLGQDRYRAAQSLSEREVDDMRRFFGAWQAVGGKPVLNKNNRNADCVVPLAEALESASFVEISRRPEYIVQSLVAAREMVQGRSEYAWGLHSEDLELGASRERLLDSVCDQVLGIQKKLRESAAAVGPERYLRVTYEDLCRSPAETVRQIAEFAPGVALRPGAELQKLKPFQSGNRWKLSDGDLDHVRARLGDDEGEGESA